MNTMALACVAGEGAPEITQAFLSSSRLGLLPHGGSAGAAPREEETQGQLRLLRGVGRL